jgi:hypothetical protein
MIIKGVVEVEGVRLVINVEAPDDEREIHVTNIHPSFLVVSKERWPIEFLDLNPEVYTALKTAGIITLGDITDADWEVRLPKAMERYYSDVVSAVGEVRGLAVVFEQAPYQPQLERLEALPISSPEAAPAPEVPRSSSFTLDTEPAQVGIPENTLKKLRKAGREVGTLGAMIKLGRRKMIMTTGVKDGDIQAVEAGLRRAGFDWSTSIDPAGN